MFARSTAEQPTHRPSPLVPLSQFGRGDGSDGVGDRGEGQTLHTLTVGGLAAAAAYFIARLIA
ncbi:MAG: hypothetical protein HY033_08810 [Ignavibacteriae bacterium]|nr:hypothetical protein [Ignavibacteria bacterium]MBI3364992.1 hypothetical protein [Ignavibacteriota bacterium]